MLNRAVILIAVALLSPFLILAQGEYKDGYVIFGGDRGVETGYVEVPQKGRGLFRTFFKSSTNASVEEIRADRVIGFGFKTGEILYSVELKGGDSTSHIFAHILVDGRLSLYSDNGTLILKGESGATFELTDKNYRDVFKTNTTSCPSLSRLVDKLKFRTEPLKRMTETFNRCLQEGPQVFNPYKKKTNIFLGLSAGLDFAKMEVDAVDNFPKCTLVDRKYLAAGTFVYIPFSKSSALELGIFFRPRQLTALAQSGSTFYDIDFRYDELSFPITYRYSFWRRGKASFQGLLGTVLPFSLNQTFRMLVETESSGLVTTTASQAQSGFTNRVQFSAGLGTVLDLGTHNRLLINCTYLFGPASFNAGTGEASSSLSGFKINIGYTLR